MIQFVRDSSHNMATIRAHEGASNARTGRVVGVWQRPDTIVSSTEYRPDIDCLRAFAVSSVIAFHYDI